MPDALMGPTHIHTYFPVRAMQTVEKLLEESGAFMNGQTNKNSIALIEQVCISFFFLFDYYIQISEAINTQAVCMNC